MSNYAFPKGHSGNTFVSDLGMTMRQYIAVEAMKSFMMNEVILGDSDTSEQWLRKTAEAAYEMADIMLKVGEQ